MGQHDPFRGSRGSGGVDHGKNLLRRIFCDHFGLAVPWCCAA